MITKNGADGITIMNHRSTQKVHLPVIFSKVYGGQ